MTALDELMARAGVSKQQDEVGWRAQRALGVTATNVRDLAKGGAGVRRTLLEEKRGDPRPFYGNQYTAWGNAREPVLGQVLAGAGIDPEDRVFYAAENPRFLASPDGIGDDFTGDLMVGEIKTSKHDLTPGGEHYVRSGYADQMQWQMLVTGATRTLFVWEQHDDDWQDRGNGVLEPVPFPHKVAWINRDEDRIGQLVEIAESFLEELDGKPQFTPRELASIRVQADAMAFHRLRAKQAEQRLRDLIDGRPISEALESKRFDSVSVSFGGVKLAPKSVVDEDAAKAENPELWGQIAALQDEWQACLKSYTRTELKPASGRLTVKETQ